MNSLTTEERVLIIKTYFQNQCSVKTTHRKIRDFFGPHNRPSEPAIRNLVKKFEELGSVLNKDKSGRPKSARSNENIAAVRENVRDEPSTSIRHRSQELGISRTSLQRILVKDLKLHAYKIQLTQELKPQDHHKRRLFANWMIEQQQNDAIFSKKIIFSDEAHFSLNGYVNKQNCRIWGDENPHAIHEVAMHPKKCTVWCALWAGGIIGPYFFENANGDAVTVNSLRYRALINDYFFNEIAGIDITDVYFQQDGATPHTQRQNMELLRAKFPGRLISRFGDVEWPPRSCDLTPLDFFLWGYLKSKVYANRPLTIPALKNNIRAEIAAIDAELCEKVIENYDRRILSCNRFRGGHLEDIISHM